MVGKQAAMMDDKRGQAWWMDGLLLGMPVGACQRLPVGACGCLWVPVGMGVRVPGSLSQQPCEATTPLLGGLRDWRSRHRPGGPRSHTVLELTYWTVLQGAGS